MALSDKKILTSERNAVYVKSNVGSRLTGTTEQNKDAFDKFPQLIMDKYNELIDLLTALGLDSIDTDLSSRYTKTETDTAIATETNDLVETITYTADDGKFTITTKGGTSTTIDTNIEKIPASFELVEEDGKTYLKITNDDGSTSKTDVSSLVNIYSFSDSDTIDFTENSGQVTAVVKNNSITIDHLSLAAISTIEGYVSSAAESATAAAASATSAETSADNASTFMNSAEEHSKAANEAKTASQTAATTATEQSSVANQKAAQAENSRLLAQSYAVGGTGTRPGEDTDNAQYYAQQASAVVGGDFISKVTSPTAGNIPKLTSDGQLEDSGKDLGDLPTITKITIPAGRMRGDIDGDGKFTEDDETLIANHLNTTAPLVDETQLLCADINGDGQIKSNDSSMCAKIVAGISQPGSAGAEVTGNWTNNPNYDTEEAQFYTDITITGMTANSSASVIVKGSYESGFFTKAECMAGKLRIYAKLCPIAALTAIVTWGAGDGTAVIAAESDICEDKIFVVTYGETTLAEADIAYQAGKTLICRNGVRFAPLTVAMPSMSYRFAVINQGQAYQWTLNSSTGWSESIIDLPPSVTTEDVGKILQVNSYGYWAAAELTKEYTATTTTTWTDATGYYTQSVPVTGLLATDNPIIDLVTTTSGFEAEQAAWGKVFKVTTAANSITLYASEAITTELNLQIKVVR